MPHQTNITEKRSRIMVGTVHYAILSLTPISLPKKFISHFRTHFPNILSHRSQRNVEVIPGRQVAILLLIYARTVW